MATKKSKNSEAAAKAQAEEALAKKKARAEARKEALKNRPAGQRPNGKQIDVIKFGENYSVEKFGTPIKVKGGSLGVLVTSVVCDANGIPLAVSEAFVPGNLVVKSKKGHGTIVAYKNKKDKSANVEDTEAEDED